MKQPDITQPDITQPDITLCTVAFSAVDALALMWKSYLLHHPRPRVHGTDHGSQDGADAYLRGIADYYDEAKDEEHGGALDRLCRLAETPYTLVVDTDAEFLCPAVDEMRAILDAGHFCATISIDREVPYQSWDVGGGVRLIPQTRLSPVCALFRTQPLRELLADESFMTRRDLERGEMFDTGGKLYHTAIARGLSVVGIEKPHLKIRHFGAVSSLFHAGGAGDPNLLGRYAFIQNRLRELGGR